MNVLDYAKIVTNFSIEKKFEALGKLKKYDQSKLDEIQKIQFQSLINWLGNNILLGEYFCPAKDVLKY